MYSCCMIFDAINTTEKNNDCWQSILITLYIYICEQYQQTLQYHCTRFTNNSKPKFTDEECLTVYLFGIIQNHFTIKGIYDYSKYHLSDWFPDLPSYAAFDNRICRLNNVFPILIERISEQLFPDAFKGKTMVIDSMPVTIAGAKRCSKAKAANEIADIGFCSSKGVYYYGVKIHLLGLSQPDHLPIPACFILSKASENDITTFRS